MPRSPLPDLGVCSLSPRCPPDRGFDLKLCSAHDQAMPEHAETITSTDLEETKGAARDTAGSGDTVRHSEGLERSSDVAQTYPAPGHVHVPAWGTQSRASKGDTVQDTETPHIEKAGCRATALHSLLLPEAGQTPKITPSLTHPPSKMGTQPTSAIFTLLSPTTASSLCPPPGRHGCGGTRG